MTFRNSTFVNNESNGGSPGRGSTFESVTGGSIVMRNSIVVAAQTETKSGAGSFSASYSCRASSGDWSMGSV